MTIAHTGITVTKAQHAEVVAWYLKVLAPLGYKQVVDVGVAVGLGDKEHDADWWIIGTADVARPGSHTAFAASDRASVDAAYNIAIEAGAKDHGAPGVRERYHPNYYAAFVYDPAGNNIEILCQVPPKE